MSIIEKIFLRGLYKKDKIAQFPVEIQRFSCFWSLPQMGQKVKQNYYCRKINYINSKSVRLK